MDQLLKSKKELLAEINPPKRAGAVGYSDLVEVAMAQGYVCKCMPSDLPKELRERYTDYLTELMQAFIAAQPNLSSWDAVAAAREFRKTHRFLKEFGVPGSLSFEEPEQKDSKKVAPPDTNLTEWELYEICQVDLGYSGSYGAFKRFIKKNYGSFAEYCLAHNLDINGTNWKDVSTALRVAQKIGTMAQVQRRCPTLFHFLVENDLAKEIA